MILVEATHLVVSGDHAACRVHLAKRYQEHGQTFASAFGNDSPRPRVQELLGCCRTLSGAGSHYRMLTWPSGQDDGLQIGPR